MRPSVQVNLDRSPISGQVDVFLRGKAKDVLTRLVDLVLEDVEASKKD